MATMNVALPGTSGPLSGTGAEPALAPLSSLDTLTEINLDDLLAGLGLSRSGLCGTALARLLRARSRRLAATVLAYDDLVGLCGLSEGGAWVVELFTRGLTVTGAENVPVTGPVLVAANHPGLVDSTALMTAIGRSDLRIVAADRPFLQVLPHTRRHLFFVSEDRASRVAVIRSVGRHLADGGAVLTFPRGMIEPDPAVLPGAAASVAGWSASLDLFARFSREMTVVPAIVSGVLSARARDHKLTRFRTQPADRQWLAALLQIQRPALQDVRVRVAFGKAVRVGGCDSDPIAIRRIICEEAQRLIGQEIPEPASSTLP